MNTDILQQIRADKTARLVGARQQTSEAELLRMVRDVEPSRDFIGAFASPKRHVIAELKKASPSRGLIRSEFDPSELARELEHAGATALSVLTEEAFFLGSTANLTLARQATYSVPILCKDFIFDPYQLLVARVAGADAVLLIAAMLSDQELHMLVAEARGLGLAILGEAHTHDEIQRLVAEGIRVIGVNARDLHTFKTSLATTERLMRAVPHGCVAIAESAIQSREDVVRLEHAGAQGFLIGEYLMRHLHPGVRLQELLS